MRDYSGKTALITGASAGIGLEFARVLHSRGANVVLVARRKERLETLAESFNALRPGSAIVFPCDLSQLQSSASISGIDDLVAWIESNGVDIFVCNAGFGSFGAFDSLPRQSELDMVRVNAVAPTILLHAVIPGMKQNRSGAIVILSSVAGLQPLPYMSTYAATKAFNLSQGRSLREELKSFGVRVLVVCPGPVHTEFGEVAKFPRNSKTPHDRVESVVARSLRALEKNQAMVFPGMVALIAGTVVRLVPKCLSVPIVGRVLRKKCDGVDFL